MKGSLNIDIIPPAGFFDGVAQEEGRKCGLGSIIFVGKVHIL